jgi:hypothetical protein
MARSPEFPPVQLLMYEFTPDARFEGQLGGAVERIESGGTVQVLEAVFIQREADSGELAVIGVRGDGAGSLIAPVLEFRLDPAARRRASARALATGTSGLSGETLRRLGSGLAPGGAIAALLIRHVWAEALSDAVARSGGTLLLSDHVQHTGELSELVPTLLDAADHVSGDDRD